MGERKAGLGGWPVFFFLFSGCCCYLRSLFVVSCASASAKTTNWVFFSSMGGILGRGIDCFHSFFFRLSLLCSCFCRRFLGTQMCVYACYRWAKFPFLFFSLAPSFRSFPFLSFLIASVPSISLFYFLGTGCVCVCVWSSMKATGKLDFRRTRIIRWHGHTQQHM